MRMFWKRHERETFEGWPAISGPLAGLSEVPMMRPLAQLIEVERDVPRAVAISRNAEELRWSGEEVVELFKEVASPVGRAVLPIHLKRGGENVFVEVETGPWKRKTVRDVLRTVAVVRNSEYADAVLEVFGAYPVPEEVRYLCEQTPAALFQLDLIRYEDLERAEDRAEAFRGVAQKHWGLNLNFDPEKLALVEDLLLATLEEGAKVGSDISSGTRAPVLDALIRAFGCYVGEVLRRHASPPGSWRSVVGWGEEGLVITFPNAIADPIGKSRAFLENGLEDSAAYYVSYALKELKG